MNKKPKIGYNDLQTLFPSIAKEFHPEKNGGLKACDFFAKSNKKVWWICPKGHEYEMVINNRTGINKSGCPICTGKRIVKGINDLFTTNPDLIDKWDYEKNSINPFSTSAGSLRFVFWVCNQGHSFRARIFNMAHSKKGENCPVCRNVKTLVGVNDLLTTHPELIKEWDEEKNDIKPTEVRAGMRIKAWWKCKKGHSWQASISSRTSQGTKCPICLNQKLLSGFNDTVTVYPEIYEEWDYNANDGKTPADFIGTQSSKRIWLKCKYGHPYTTRIATYCRGSRCPICGNKKIEIGFNDLATTHPKIAKEWDNEKNLTLSPQQVTYGSDLKVWWKCEKGHSWQAAISSRTSQGHGCPKCAKEYQTSLPEKVFAFYLMKHFDDLQENVHLNGLGKMELDIYIPSLKLAIEYDGKFWHRNSKSDLNKDHRCIKNGITLIRIREDGCINYDSPAHFILCPQNHGNILILKDALNELFNIINKLYGLSLNCIISIEEDLSAINNSFYSYIKSNSLRAKHPELLEEWDYKKNGDLNPENINAGSNCKVWWKCKYGHSWSAIVSSRSKGNGCPTCSGKKVLTGFNDLASLYPNLTKEWDYEKNGDLTPETIYPGSNLKVWWKCNNNHSWKTKINLRTRMKTGCPVCAGLMPIRGKNDLETLFPDLAKEWDYEKNGDLLPSDVLPGSERKAWWICPKGHSYNTQISIRAKVNCKCPICNNKRILKGFNDLETLHPELSKEWNYEKNAGLLPSQVGGTGGSHKKFWWKCINNHEWVATLASRINLHTGCPICARNRKKK